MLASTGSSRHWKLPAAPKVLEIDGQASDRSTLVRSSTRSWAASRIVMAPLSMRISDERGDSVSRLEGARQRGEQRRPVVRPSAPISTSDARMLERDIGDLDAAEQQRQDTQAGDQPLGRKRRRCPLSSPSTTSPRLTGAGRKTATPRSGRGSTGSSPVTARNLRLDGIAGAVSRDQQGGGRKRREGRRDHDADGDPETLQAGGRSHCWRKSLCRIRFLAHLGARACPDLIGGHRFAGENATRYGRRGQTSPAEL